ncbi:MAG: hypothetical protein NC489_07990 [Ruminococcus flavefaciens]|nr:hypothetical protein [Ruminococcus flavefaciens]
MNVLALTEAVTRAATRGIASNIAPYQFASDNINECSAEMDLVIMTESVEMAEMFMVTEEIMAEAAINNPAALDTINENVFSKIWDGMKKFFDKIISMVKGIIDKLKAHIYKMSGKTSKWLTVMKPKIEDVKRNQSGYEKVTFEGYDYDAAYIKDGMNSGVAALGNDWKKSVIPSLSDAEKTGQSLMQQVAKLRSNTDAGVAASRDASVPDGQKANAVDSKNSNLTQYQGWVKEEATRLENYKKNFPKTVASAMSAGGATTLDAVWTACAKKARGGKSEKSTITVGSKVDTMISALEGMGDAVTTLKETYENHLKDLVDFKSDLDSDTFKLEDDDKVPGNVMGAIRDLLSAKYKYITEVTSLVENAMNTAKTQNLAYLQEMGSSYMSALTTFAAYKGSKK